MRSRPKFHVPKARNPFASSFRPAGGHLCGARPFVGDKVLERLLPQEQEVVILSSFYGLAKDEIASIVGSSIDVVDTLLCQAKEHLRRLLTPVQGSQAA
jgi:hypothetical protein